MRISTVSMIPPRVTGQQAERDADDDREQHRSSADHQADAACRT